MRSLIALVASAVVGRCAALGEVRELNDETFASVVDGSTNVLVEFYKPDCGHCQTMEPEFYATAEALQFEGDVVLARVDTEESPKTGKRFGIDGHPIFRWFKKTSTDDDKFYFVHYDGRMANTFLKMIGERTGATYPKLEVEHSKVKKIKAEEFEGAALDSSVDAFVAMYTPWTESKPVVETLDAVAKTIHKAGAPSAVYKMGIERVYERDVADKYECKKYPCYFLFPKGGAPHIRYEGPDDDHERIVAFLNTEANLGLDPLGHVRKAEIGRLAALDAALAAEDVAAALAAASANLPADQAGYAAYYAKAAAKAAESPTYVADELARLQKVLKTTPTLTPAKRKEFTARKNILAAFAVHAGRDGAAHGGEL